MAAMKINITLQGISKTVELSQPGDRPRWSIDGRELEADAIEISPGVYSILINGESIEAKVAGSSSSLRVVANGEEYVATIENVRGLKKNRAGATEVAGRQSIVAPMAGKIIRTLVTAGDDVESGQGLMIVEAMKMQNEIRSPKSGKVERIAVVEGQTVNPGDIVAVVA
jgi:biotin carboxyl carrier protein